jgi:hypothetical protein
MLVDTNGRHLLAIFWLSRNCRQHLQYSFWIVFPFNVCFVVSSSFKLNNVVSQSIILEIRYQHIMTEWNVCNSEPHVQDYICLLWTFTHPQTLVHSSDFPLISQFRTCCTANVWLHTNYLCVLQNCFFQCPPSTTMPPYLLASIS